jgi:hypothetical protein
VPLVRPFHAEETQRGGRRASDTEPCSILEVVQALARGDAGADRASVVDTAQQIILALQVSSFTVDPPPPRSDVRPSPLVMRPYYLPLAHRSFTIPLHIFLSHFSDPDPSRNLPIDSRSDELHLVPTRSPYALSDKALYLQRAEAATDSAAKKLSDSEEMITELKEENVFVHQRVEELVRLTLTMNPNPQTFLLPTFSTPHSPTCARLHPTTYNLQPTH